MESDLEKFLLRNKDTTSWILRQLQPKDRKKLIASSKALFDKTEEWKSMQGFPYQVSSCLDPKGRSLTLTFENQQNYSIMKKYGMEVGKFVLVFKNENYHWLEFDSSREEFAKVLKKDSKDTRNHTLNYDQAMFIVKTSHFKWSQEANVAVKSQVPKDKKISLTINFFDRFPFFGEISMQIIYFNDVFGESKTEKQFFEVMNANIKAPHLKPRCGFW